MFKNRQCTECHPDEGKIKSAPELTGYGDAEWLRLMIMSPSHPARYGTRNRMPAFRDLEGPTAAVTQEELKRTKELLLREIPEDDAQAAKKKKDIEEATHVVNLSDLRGVWVSPGKLGGKLVYGDSDLLVLSQPFDGDQAEDSLDLDR